MLQASHASTNLLTPVNRPNSNCVGAVFLDVSEDIALPNMPSGITNAAQHNSDEEQLKIESQARYDSVHNR